MYIPANMEIDDPVELREFISTFSFATLVSSDLQATHMPLVLEPDSGEHGALIGHFARANRHWKKLDGSQVLVMFWGPHTYISPTWYADAPAVPTWNYAAVHVTGQLSLCNAEGTTAILDKMMGHYEPQLLRDRDVVTHDIQAKMLGAIVGFRIAIETIEGKQKLGQLRSEGDQRGVTSALTRSDRRDAQELLDFMKHKRLGLGDNHEE
ncbi:MAG: FMN-binding negative transcriptional regulator [Pseudomonadota bacterium]